MEEIVKTLGSILALVIGVALAATILSKNANTSKVIQAGAVGFSQILGAATAPVTQAGGGFTSFNYPG